MTVTSCAQVSVTVSRFVKDAQNVPMVKLVVEQLGAAVIVRPFDMSVNAYLGGIFVQHLEFRGRYCCSLKI